MSIKNPVLIKTREQISSLIIAIIILIIGGCTPFILRSITTQIFVTVSLIFIGSFGLLYQVFLTILSKRLQIDIFSPIILFPILYSLFYGVGSLVYTNANYLELPVREYVLYYGGLIAYLLGTVASSKFPWFQKSPATFKQTRMKHAIFVLFVISILSYAYTTSLTGIPILFGDIENTRVAIVEQVGGFVSYFTNSLEIVVILLFVYAFLYTKKYFPYNHPVWITLILTSLVLLGSLGARRRLATPLLVGLVLFHYLRKRIRLSLIIPLGIGAFGFFILFASWRQSANLQVDLTDFNRILYTESVRGVAALHDLSEVIPSQFDYLRWQGLFLPITVLAPGQQRPLGIILKEDILQRNFSGGGYVPTILGYFYVLFGDAAVIVGMLMFGFLIGTLYYKMLTHKDAISTTIYSYAAVYCLSALRNGFLQLWPVYVVTLIYIVYIYGRLKLTRRELNGSST